MSQGTRKKKRRKGGEDTAAKPEAVPGATADQGAAPDDANLETPAMSEAHAAEALAELSDDARTRFADEEGPGGFPDEWITAPVPREAPRPLPEPGDAQAELDEREETRTAARQPLPFLAPSSDDEESEEGSAGGVEDRFDFGAGTGKIAALEDASDPIDTPPDPGSADAGSPRLQSIVESVLFAADRPMNLRQLADLVEEPELERVRAAVLAVEQSWRERGVQLHEVAGGYQFRTHPANAMWVQKLLQQKPVRLSRALLETLAIVAYRQPITRPEIDEIRGVDSGGTLKTLMDRSLVRILGKREEPGRPLLYGSTKEFLEFFSLRDLKDLPTLREYHELSEEHQAQVAALEEVAPAGSIMAEGELADDELPKLSRLEIAAPREDAAELAEIDRLIRTAGTSVATDSDLPQNESAENVDEELITTGKFPALRPQQAGGDFDEERQLTNTYGDPLPDPQTDDGGFHEQEEPTQFRADGLDSSLIDGRDPDKEPQQ
jgi:segregation and condensation protein B